MFVPGYIGTQADRWQVTRGQSLEGYRRDQAHRPAKCIHLIGREIIWYLVFDLVGLRVGKGLGKL